MSGDLFGAPPVPGILRLSGFAAGDEAALIEGASAVAVISPFRVMAVPGGAKMSAAMTNCGAAGWVTDRTGYRYDPCDPDSGRPWPGMPAAFLHLATAAAEAAGFADFVPDACLINRYQPGARLSLHQDRNERDMDAPIVSVSLGLPAVFQFGGMKRTDPVRRIALQHGDVVVWGGLSRLRYHGVLPLADGEHPAFGRARVNLTFRKAL